MRVLTEQQLMEQAEQLQEKLLAESVQMTITNAMEWNFEVGSIREYLTVLEELPEYYVDDFRVTIKFVIKKDIDKTARAAIKRNVSFMKTVLLHLKDIELIEEG